MEAIQQSSRNIWMDKKVKQKCVSWMLRSTGTIVSEICLNLIGSDRITFKVSWVVAMSIPLLRYNVWSCFHGIHQHRHGCVLTVLGSFHMDSHSPGPCSLLIHLNHLICVVTYHMLLYLFVSRFICSVLICHIKNYVNVNVNLIILIYVSFHTYLP